MLDVATEELGRAWGAVSHLNSVADTPELRAAYNEALPRVTEFWTRLGADERLYAKYKAIDPAPLNAEQRQAQKNAVRNFVLCGRRTHRGRQRALCPDPGTPGRAAAKSSARTRSTPPTPLPTTQPPKSSTAFRKMCSKPHAQAAEAEGKEGYKLTLKMPCYLPVMQFARSSALRERLYRAYVTRASDQAEGDATRFDNSAFIQEILALRQEEARLLGYTNFGEVSVVPKMAESPDRGDALLARPGPPCAPLRRERRGRSARLRCRTARL